MDGLVFISLLIIAVTKVIKLLAPQVTGVITIVAAVVVGALVGAFDVNIGVADITVAAGILAGLAAVGIATTADRIGGQG